MLSSLRTLLALACVSVLCVGCDRHVLPSAPTPMPTQEIGPSSYLAVSTDSPEIGSEVTIVGNADKANSAKDFGSFRARVTYDRARLEFVSESVLPGAMRAMRVDSGVVTVAGAAVGGFDQGRLFAIRFRVLHPQPFTSMTMVVDELNGVDFLSQLKSLTVRATMMLDRTIR